MDQNEKKLLIEAVTAVIPALASVGLLFIALYYAVHGQLAGL